MSRNIALAGLLAVALLMLATPLAAMADESEPPNPVYTAQLTPNPSPGPGTPVTAIAQTNDTSLTLIVFKWVNPLGAIVATDKVTSWTPCSTFPNCRQFTDKYSPNVPGDWIVRVKFKASKELDARVRVSLLVLNELPFGALAAAAVPGVALLGYGMYRKRN